MKETVQLLNIYIFFAFVVLELHV